MPKRRILAPLVCKDSANHVKRKIKVRETNFYFALKPWQNQYLYINADATTDHKASISSIDKPKARDMTSGDSPNRFALRALSNFSSARPSAYPSAKPSANPFAYPFARPSFLAYASVTRLSRYTLMASSYFMRSSFERAAMSFISSTLMLQGVNLINRQT